MQPFYCLIHYVSLMEYKGRNVSTSPFNECVNAPMIYAYIARCKQFDRRQSKVI